MKKLLICLVRSRTFEKILIKMKLTLTILLFCIVSVNATTYSQNTKLNIDISGKSVIELFNEIEEKSDFYFFYQKEDLQQLQEVNVAAKNATVMEILDDVLEGTSLDYKIVDKYIVIRDEDNDLFNAMISAQQNRVTGIVTDESGQPLPGVTVVVKGTTTGTVTDESGRYTLSGVNSGTILVFSFVGMKPQEVPVADQSVINVTLALDAIGIEEVVAIGFGTQKRRDITGSVASVKGETLAEMPVPTLEQSLSGRAAGVQVISSSGVPGAGASIRVRGVGTLNNNEPLYVIDGIILGNVNGGGDQQGSVSPLSMINPNDIESIDILKDASATAIYGARAGNGVVIITTKRGTGVKMNITYDAFSSMNILDESNYNRLTGPEWASYYDNLQKYSGFDDYQGQPFINRILAGENIPTYDWVDEVTRRGEIQSHNLSVTGGSESSNYFTSLSYYDQKGVFYGSDLERYTMRFNSDHKIGKFKFGNTLLISRSITNEQGNINPNNNANNYLRRGLAPDLWYKPIYREDGTYAGSNSHDPDSEGLLDQANQHIVWHIKNRIELNSANRVWASAYLDYEIVDED